MGEISINEEFFLSHVRVIFTAWEKINFIPLNISTMQKWLARLGEIFVQ